MSLQHAAHYLASQGRGPDDTLVHMTRREVQSLQDIARANGGSLTVNPETGLVEAGFLKNLLPMIAGMGITALTGGAAAPWMIGLGVGGVQAARTGSLEKGLMAGLGAYGGAGLGGALSAAGSTAAQNAAISSGGSQHVMDLASGEAAKQAAANPFSTMASGVQSLGTEAGRNAAIGSLGGNFGAAKTAGMALAPALMDSGEGSGEAPKDDERYVFDYKPNRVADPNEGYTGAHTGERRYFTPSYTRMPNAKGYAEGGVSFFDDGGAVDESMAGLQGAAKMVGIAPFNQQTASYQTPGPTSLPFNQPATSTTPAGSIQPTTDNPYYKMTGASGDAYKYLMGQGTSSAPTNPVVATKPIITPQPTGGGGGGGGSRTDVGVGDTTMTPITFPPSEVKDEIDQVTEDDDAAREIEDVTADDDLVREIEHDNAETDLVDELEAVREWTDATEDDDVVKEIEDVTADDDLVREIEHDNEETDLINEIQNERDRIEQEDAEREVEQVTEEDDLVREIEDVTAEDDLVREIEHDNEETDLINEIQNERDRIEQEDAEREVEQVTEEDDLVREIEDVTAEDENVRQIEDALREEAERLHEVNDNPYVSRTQVNDGGYCPAPWINILLADGGTVKAGDIKPGMEVYTRHENTNEWGVYPVSDVEMSEGNRWEVLLEDGRSFVGTFNHRVHTGDGWTKIRFLKAGDKLVQPEGFGVVKSSAELDYGPVVRITVEDAHTYVSEGFLSHNVKKMSTDFGDFDYSDYNGYDWEGWANGGMVPGYAMGGSTLGDYSDGGRLLRGPGDGVSDSIPATIANRQPARLADGEFVIPARIVSELGNGSTEAGARKLYAMMDRIQKTRGKTVGKGRVATNSRADKHLPA